MARSPAVTDPRYAGTRDTRHLLLLPGIQPTYTYTTLCPQFCWQYTKISSRYSKACFQSIRNCILHICILYRCVQVQVTGWTLDKQKSPNEHVPYIDRYCHEISRSVCNKRKAPGMWPSWVIITWFVCMIMMMLERRTSVHTIYYVHNASLQYWS